MCPVVYVYIVKKTPIQVFSVGQERVQKQDFFLLFRKTESVPKGPNRMLVAFALLLSYTVNNIISWTATTCLLFFPWFVYIGKRKIHFMRITYVLAGCNPNIVSAHLDGVAKNGKLVAQSSAKQENRLPFHLARTLNHSAGDQWIAYGKSCKWY